MLLTTNLVHRICFVELNIKSNILATFTLQLTLDFPIAFSFNIGVRRFIFYSLLGGWKILINLPKMYLQPIQTFKIKLFVKNSLLFSKNALT